MTWLGLRVVQPCHPARPSPAEFGFFDVTVSFAICIISFCLGGGQNEQVTMDARNFGCNHVFCGAFDFVMARRAHKSAQGAMNGKGNGQDKQGQLNVSLCREVFESFDWVCQTESLIHFATDSLSC